MVEVPFSPVSSSSTEESEVFSSNAKHASSSSSLTTASIYSTATAKPVNHAGQRWSDVVPPHTALTFAAVYDKDEGLVSFSGAKLFDSDESSPELPRIDVHAPDSPQDACDTTSTILALDKLAMPSGDTQSPRGTMADFNSYFGSYLEGASATPITPNTNMARGVSRHRHKPSSTNGLGDVYVRDSACARETDQQKNEWRKFSCLDGLEGEFELDLDEAFAQWAVTQGVQYGDIEEFERRDDGSVQEIAVYKARNPHARRRSDNADDEEGFDEGFFESAALTPPWGGNGGLFSRFSMTTTSTSNYVTVNTSDESLASTCWSEVGAPVVTPTFAFYNLPPKKPRRLKKPRPASKPAGVLARELNNHHPVVPVRPPPSAFNPRLAFNSSSASLPSISSLCSRWSAPSSKPRRPFISRARTLSFGALVRKAKTDEDTDQWVCVDVERYVEVTEEITVRAL